MRRMTASLKLVIGNKNYSTWSLRPWLALRHAGIPFEEIRLSFNDVDFAATVRRLAPASAGKVPVLLDGDVAVWDSLAITEYVAEKFPDKGLWPAAPGARAHARSVCAEMHSGFADLRSTLTMNCEAHLPGVRVKVGVQREIDRILDIWRVCRERFGAGGPFLFGAFSIADAFFAPVTQRFVVYDVPVPPAARDYVDTIQALPAMSEWVKAARAENDFVPRDEPYRTARPG
jgi:glutathione S-transferase